MKNRALSPNPAILALLAAGTALAFLAPLFLLAMFYVLCSSIFG